MGIVTIVDHGSGISADDVVAPPGELAGGRVLAPAENSELVAHVWPLPATVARRGLWQIAAPGGSASADPARAHEKSGFATRGTRSVTAGYAGDADNGGTSSGAPDEDRARLPIYEIQRHDDERWGGRPARRVRLAPPPRLTKSDEPVMRW